MPRAQSTVAFACLVACLALQQGACSPDPGATSDGGTPTASCSSDLANDSLNCGVCGHVCAAHEPCSGGKCGGSCDGKTIYVTPKGDDRVEGCSPDRPLKTLAGAVSRARSLGELGLEIHACRGTYEEKNLVLDYPVSLRGGYDCTTFVRGAGAETVLVDGNSGSERTALTIRGTELTRSVKVDGLTIKAARAAREAITQPTLTQVVGVAVLDGASPTLRTLKIEGGESYTRTDVLIGLDSKDSSPDLGDLDILGGFPSSSEEEQVIGLRVTGGSPVVHESRIRGTPDSGTTPGGNVSAASIDGAQIASADAWYQVAFTAGTASVSGAALRIAGGSKLAISKSRFTGPTPLYTNKCMAFGIAAADSELDVSQSLVFGGGTQSYLLVDVVAVEAVRSTLALTNDVIVTGTWSNGDGTAVAVRGGRARLVHNTLLTQDLYGVAHSPIGIWVTDGAADVDLVNNLLVGGGTGYLTGLRVDGACDGFVSSTVRDVRANVFVNIARFLELHEASECAASFSLLASEAETVLALHASGVVRGNVRFTEDCTGEPMASCRACGSRTECATSVVWPWVLGPTAEDLFSERGYSLSDNAPCGVATGAVAVIPPVTVDVNGVPRGIAPSIGAFERPPAGTCAP